MSEKKDILKENIEEYYQKEYTQEKGESGYYLQQIGINWKDPGKLKVTGFDTKEEVLKAAKIIINSAKFLELAGLREAFYESADGGHVQTDYDSDELWERYGEGLLAVITFGE